MPIYTKTKNFHHQLAILGKLLTIFSLFLAAFATISAYSCEKHEPINQITFRNPEAKLAVTQHFSLGSPEFVRFAKEEFPVFKANFIDTGFVSWTFCPHVVDLATIQLVSCLETLSFSQKPQFFNRVLLEVSPRTFGEIPQILIRSLEGLSISEKKLELLQLLKLGEFFCQAGEFLDQKVFAAPPSHIEIGERTFDYLINPAVIRYQIKQQLINE
ncbi:MAG: hypothetical protein KDK96_11070 [Chlamydiia bacterium]|nr:hypothetical protein [Chlamydiia bacterium]